MGGTVTMLALVAGLLVMAPVPAAPLPPSFGQLDADGDDRLTAPEVRGTIVEPRFAAMDLDRDGRIDRREYLSAMGLEGSGPSTFDRLDAGGDGALSPDEAGALPGLGARFSASDADGDGALDRSEFSAFQATEAMEGMDLPPLRRPRPQR